MEDQSEPVRVFIRIRPEGDSIGDNTPAKNSRGQKTVTATSNNCCQILDAQSIKIMPPDGVYGSRKNVAAVDDKEYTFDRVFPPTCTQEDIYRSVSDYVQATVNGYNTTIFAYGTTGSGKSFTMTGDKTSPGIIPRAIGDLFRHIELAAAEENDVFFYVRLSYVELYNNTFRNLLENVKSASPNVRPGSNKLNMSINGFFTELDDNNDNGATTGPSFAHARNNTSFEMKMHPGLAHRNDKIEVRESQSAGVFLAGPNLRIPVTSATEAYQLIGKGNKNRAVGATACNDVSSRSHAILTFHVESRILSSMNGTSTSNLNSASVKSELRLGKIHLVDLAGSERLNLSGAEGETRLETQQINLSLTALGDVLSALSKNATVMANHAKSVNRSFDASQTLKLPPTQVPVPYRNSKLTHLLKDSLGGNSKTVMITTIRTTDEYYQQTSISLMYASRAKKVRNHSSINRNATGDTGINAVSSEIERLKKSLEERSVEFERLRMAQLQDAQENSSLKVRLQELKITNENEKAMLEKQVSHVIHSQAGHIASQREKISTLQNALQDELTLSQNRIAEQEKEIKWLKKALDETSQAAQGPHDQLQRLQKMVEAWQTQAKTTHQELSIVLKQAEELKTMNSQLNSKLLEVEAAKRQLVDEISEHEQENIDATNSLRKQITEKEELHEQLTSMERAYQDAKNALKDKAEALFDKEFVLKEHSKLISALEHELKITKETAAAVQKDSHQTTAKLTMKVAELENDKGELTSRLNNAVSTLEKSTTRVVEDANVKMQAKDSKIKQADEKANHLKTEVDHYKKLMEEYKRQLDTREAVHSAAIAELQGNLKEERVANSQQAARILSLEGLADGFRDKILKLKTKDKEMMDSLKATVEHHEKEIREKDRALFILGEQRDSERVTLMTEFERILEEKTLKHQIELKEAHDGATIGEERMASIQAKHIEEISRLRIDFTSKESFFQHQLQETESQVKLMIENEIDGNIKKLEAAHQQHLQKVRHDHELELRAALQEAMAASGAAAHKQHLQAMEQRHAVYTAELDTMRTEFAMQLKAAQEDGDAQAEQLKRQHEENIAKLQKTHQLALSQLETKITDQCDAHYDANLKAAEEKHRKDLATALEREHTKFTTHYEGLIEGLRNDAVVLKEKHQHALKNIEFQRELHLQESIESERSKFLIQAKDASEEQRKTLAAEFAEQLRAQEKRLMEKHAAQIDYERRQVMGEQEDALQQLASQQRREIENVNTRLEEAKEHHQRELDLLTNANKKALADQKREIEVLQRVANEEHERALQVLRDQIAQMKLAHEESLQESLADQQKELIDRQRSESLKLRMELQALESNHQADLNAALQDHMQEMAKQRKQLESAQGNLVTSLQEELAAAKDRCNELLALGAAKEGQESAALVEYKARADETLRRQLEERDRQYKADLESVETQATSELNKVRLAMDKMKARHAVELLSKEKENSNDVSRAITALKDKHRGEISKLQAAQEQRLTSAISEIAGKGKLDYLRLMDEKKEDDQKSEASRAKAEAKIRELNQALQKQRVQFDADSLKLVEEHKQAEELAIARHQEEVAKFESLHAELENRLESKHLLVVNTIRDEAAAELARAKVDAQTALQRREAQHAQEVDALRQSMEEEQAARFEELEQLTAQLSEMRRKFNSASGELKTVQQELADTQAQHEEEAQRSNKLGSDVTELAKRHSKELQRIRDERAEYERASVENEERITRELQEVKLASRKLTSELQEAVLEKEFEMQRQLSALRQQHLMEVQEQITHLKAQHEQQLEDLQRLKDAETAALKDARASIATLTDKLAQSTAAQAQLQADYDAQLENLNETSSTELSYLRERITRMTEEAENQAAEIQQAMEKRTEDLEESLEEEKARFTQRQEEHLAELQDLQEQMKAQIQAERVVKANELDELRMELTTTHQREIKELRLKMEAGAALASSLKDEMGSRLSAALNEKEAQLRELQEAMKMQLSATLGEREAQLKAEFERERSRLLDQHEDALQTKQEAHQSELVRRIDELTSNHHAELSAMQKRHAAALRDHSEDRGTEVVTLQRQLCEKDEEKHDVLRQLAKSEAIREVLKQDTENMRSERQQLREKVHVLELEIIEHGKAKFDAKLIAEKERLEQSYKSAFEEVNQEVAAKIEENKALSHKLSQGELEIAAIRANLRAAQDERERIEASLKSALTEKDASHAAELKRSLTMQEAELQATYLKLIQQQVDALVGLIQNQTSEYSNFDLQERFLMLIRQIPESWNQENPDQFTFELPAARTPPQKRPSPVDPLPKTPLHLLGQAARGKEEEQVDQDLDGVRRSRFGGRQSLPWSSPSLRSSPTDQLIAAILDGDVQGIRAVVRSKGEDLRSEFWRELSRSVFPLHRAVSGLHFHGSEKLLVAAIETLAQLGADVNAVDHAGNSVLHKAIQVCTSKSAAAVVKTLLQRGADPSLKNKDGDTPLHSECKRVRSASVEVIEALVAAGADPDSRNLNSASVSPLTLVILRGAASTSTGVRLIGVGEEAGLGLGLSPPGNGRIATDDASVSSAQPASGDADRARVAGRRVWIRAAEMLIKCGAHWDVNWQTNKGCNQLHLFLSAFPPSRDDTSTYRKLLKSALENGLEVGTEEERGRNALFVLCEQMATVGSDACPDAPRLVHMLLGGVNPAHGSVGSAARRLVNAADRTGRTVFDISDRADHSCLAACRHVLRDASQGVLHIDSANYAGTQTTGNGGIRRAGNLNNEWELERPRSSSALIARVSQLSGAGGSAKDLNASANSTRGEAELKRKTSSASVTNAARVATNTMYNSSSMSTTTRSQHESSYLDEQYSDSPPVPLLRSAEPTTAQYGSSYYSPAVASRRRPAFDEKS